MKSITARADLAELATFLRRHPRRVVLTGAGCSTESADVLLVVGSSLAVWSGFRFARAAAAAGVEVALLNLGWTRADEIASIKLERPCGEALPALADALDGERGDA